jgi:large subunit ribosomal protein L2
MEDLLSTLSKRSHLKNYLSFLYTKFLINPSLFILRKLPRNQFISLIELYPNKKIEYVRAPGSKSKMIKMDTRTNTSIVKLPSGVKKVFSIYSLASLGQVLFDDKRLKVNNKAGFFNKKGKKPKVRGVAMNPVDHPHGGRTKAIRYQRTP